MCCVVCACDNYHHDHIRVYWLIGAQSCVIFVITELQYSLLTFTVYCYNCRHVVFVGPLENLNATIQAFLALFEVAELEWPFILVPV